jgi:hypothetical protein
LSNDRLLQDRGYVWNGSREEENVFEDNGTYQPDDPSTEEVKFKVQEPEENVFQDVEVQRASNTRPHPGSHVIP